jgi:hypothetical protein
MLTFTSLGGTGIRLTGGEKPILVFPPDSVKKDADMTILLSLPEEDPVSAIVSWPGEYSIANASIRGIGHTEGRQVSYVVELDGVRTAFLSSPLQDWTDKQLEMVGDIDVLVLPTDEVKLVQKLVDEFDPRALLLIPSQDVQEVVKTIGAKETVSEYKLKGALPAEGREVYVLSR